MVKDFINLLLPGLCETCSSPLVKGERIVCLKCLYDLPRTRYNSYRDNPVAMLFWGRVPVQNAGSYFKFQPGSRFQCLVHNLKYRGRPDIGREFGRLMGIELKDSPFSEADIILPVPIHRLKEFRRGYNQADPICEGLSASLGIPWRKNLLVKTSSSGSQTNKSRFRRWTNVEGLFLLRSPEALEGKHVLIADDVVTTGSTLEACAAKILELEGTCVSIVTLAVALKSF